MKTLLLSLLCLSSSISVSVLAAEQHIGHCETDPSKLPRWSVEIYRDSADYNGSPRIAVSAVYESDPSPVQYEARVDGSAKRVLSGFRFYSPSESNSNAGTYLSAWHHNRTLEIAADSDFFGWKTQGKEWKGMLRDEAGIEGDKLFFRYVSPVTCTESK